MRETTAGEDRGVTPSMYQLNVTLGGGASVVVACTCVAILNAPRCERFDPENRTALASRRPASALRRIFIEVS